MTEIASKLGELTKRRGIIKAQVTRFGNFLESCSDINQINLRLAKFEGLLPDFEKIQTEIDILNNEQGTSDEWKVFEDSYYKLLTTAKSKIQSNNTPVKLPTITLPTFSGEYDEWPSFHDSFKTLIHNNINLSDCQKFQYLKLSLKDNAANILQSLEGSSDNYKIGWDLLVERFQNKRLLIDKHVTALFNLQRSDKESSAHLRNLVDEVQKHLRSLSSLGEPTDKWDTLIIHMIIKSLDNNTHREWESGRTPNEIPALSDLIKFLNKKSQMLEAVGINSAQSVKPNQYQIGKNSNSKTPSKYNTTSAHVATSKKCFLCDESHQLYLCNKFKALSIAEREEQVKRLGLCFNCLSSTEHTIKNCGAGSCRICRKRHNTLLHYTKDSVSEHSFPSSSTFSDNNSNNQTNTVASTSHISCGELGTSILLSTALIVILDNRGSPQMCKALLDSGSQSNFITERLVNRLHLPVSKITVEVSGIGQAATNISNATQCVIKSRLNAFSSTIDCIVMRTITQQLPTVSIDKHKLNIPSNLNLADPHFDVTSDIDMLIGAELFFELLTEGKFRCSDSTPILQNSVFGWIVSGKINVSSNTAILCHLSTFEDINRTIQRFWELEDFSGERDFTGNDKVCEELFSQTTIRDANGRYCVQIPLKGEVAQLGESKDIAFRRLLSIERRLSSKPELRSQYVNFLKEYEQLGHMKEITSAEVEASNAYYIPHHCVTKQDSTTTKLRVVFDASSKTTSGLSLNDISIIGPKVQSDLVDIVTRFRTHRYVLTADIEKMYRQVIIHPSQQNLQLILWRESSDQPVKTFKLLTVTYGTASAPYLATRALKQLALDEQRELPVASRVIKEDVYVDDVISGAETIEAAIQLRRDLTELTRRGGFHLRKWNSNNPNILCDIPPEDIGSGGFELDQDITVKTLGLIWNPRQDTFHFYVRQDNSSIQHSTKRTILSSIGKIFDPLGLIGPVVLVAKLIMQRLWTYQVGWDEEVPSELLIEWRQFQASLSTLAEIRVPRPLLCTNQNILALEIHGFSDASEVAYGACIYLRSIDIHGNITVSLVVSKSRVAPLKKVSLPRLELCGALLLAELGSATIEALHLKINNISYYTDSTITLAWIQAPSSHWTTFVANRVAKIQTISTVDSWKHVSSQENPADFMSRGLQPSELVGATLYWNGPSFLHTMTIPPETFIIPDPVAVPERRHHVLTTSIYQPCINPSDFSSFTKLQRVLGYCLRFITNSLSKKSRLKGELSVAELKVAELTLIKMVQKEAFPQEVSALQSGKAIERQSKLIALSPFMDQKQVIRVGGRLRHSELTPDQIHPIVLPRGHALTELIATHFHIKTMHAGPQLLLHVMRQKYWPIDGRNLVRRIFRRCVTCFKLRPTPQSQLMGDLPQARVQQPPRPFYATGVDYCGPFFLKMTKRRGVTPTKCYICLFVCFSVKAVHLELVEDLTTAAFIAALRRFISRRGKPKDIYSDNGTNFVGAFRELKELWKTEEFKGKVSSTLAQDQINWHFQPPRAPHFGGLWESSVKLIKTHIKRVIGNNILTYVQFSTLLVQVEACINSRPLTPLSNEPSDLYPLTPSHFLIGDVLTKTPEPILTHLPPNRLNQWQQVQQLSQHFWSRWSRDYLNNLQQRGKWKLPSTNLKTGDLVIIKEDNTPPLQWKMGRVIETHPGADGMTRVATLRTALGHIKRPITKLCVLPHQN